MWDKNGQNNKMLAGLYLVLFQARLQKQNHKLLSVLILRSKLIEQIIGWD